MTGVGTPLTPGPSPGGRGRPDCKPQKAPLPPGEGLGEGRPPPAHGEPVEPRGNLDEVAMVVGRPGKRRFNPRPRVCAVTQSPPPSVPAPANHPSRRPGRCFRTSRTPRRAAWPGHIHRCPSRRRAIPPHPAGVGVPGADGGELPGGRRGLAIAIVAPAGDWLHPATGAGGEAPPPSWPQQTTAPSGFRCG